MRPAALGALVSGKRSRRRQGGDAARNLRRVQDAEILDESNHGGPIGEDRVAEVVEPLLGKRGPEGP